VADRLNFVAGLELLVFDEPSKSHLLERRQLHRILADHTWIFGEEFNLSVDDRSLTSVLNAHLKLLGREPEDKAAAVLREDGSVGIVNLMLSRLIPQPRSEEREHLVIELKAPTVDIDGAAMLQIQSYALAVADDERDTKTRWVFWAVSNNVRDSVRKSARQRNRPEGVYYEDEEQRITIWVKTWGQVIQECKGRLQFYREQLGYAARF